MLLMRWERLSHEVVHKLLKNNQYYVRDENCEPFRRNSKLAALPSKPSLRSIQVAAFYR
jgi:hypothetical protein